MADGNDRGKDEGPLCELGEEDSTRSPEDNRHLSLDVSTSACQVCGVDLL